MVLMYLVTHTHIQSTVIELTTDPASDDQVHTFIEAKSDTGSEDGVLPVPTLLKNLYETCSIHPVVTCKIEDAMQNTKYVYLLLSTPLHH